MFLLSFFSTAATTSSQRLILPTETFTNNPDQKSLIPEEYPDIAAKTHTLSASFPQSFPQLCGKGRKNLKLYFKLFVYNSLQETGNIETDARLTQRQDQRKEKSTEKKRPVTFLLSPLYNNSLERNRYLIDSHKGYKNRKNPIKNFHSEPCLVEKKLHCLVTVWSPRSSGPQKA